MKLIDRFQDKTILSEALLAQAVVQGDKAVADALSAVGELREFATDEVLIQQGGADRDIYYLLTGKVSVRVKGQEVATRVKNQTVGEMSAVNSSIPRSADVVATETTVALQVSSSNLEKVAATHPRVYKLIASELASRLLQRNDLIRSPNERSRVFFICSKEALDVAEALRHGLCHEPADGVIWSDDNIFPAGGYPLEALETEVNRAHRAA
ncbi:Crp/Fnr family transcriptional regulator [Mitsuaria sp. 7]|uniref:Crp/Fnr family transcriptional regulator n=1 Tax=Mitsuaria sp. 7 TaxID=1658665 RepID=UPI00082C20F9|nr:cyclic nucleotide-binding domain-containing protein [Mitsuaria sp. 7]